MRLIHMRNVLFPFNIAMKAYPLYLLACLGLAGFTHAAITVPGADGSDGALVITEDTEIDLSQAVNGDGTTVKWDTNNAANAGKGIYDPMKWAVVFKYSSVNVATGTTVTFKNHASRAPVVWLVSGDVTIDGTVSLNGAHWVESPTTAQPGPGGFRGGFGTFSTGVTAGAGFGPGGGARDNNEGFGGSYGTQGSGGPLGYGNQSLVPLIGGSGGGSDPERTRSGGAGGGAILIACTSQVTINGAIQSNGGDGFHSFSGTDWNSAGGSGGGIRVVADTLAGTGALNALAGNGGHRAGGLGRIRIERTANSNTIAIVPDPSIVNLAAAATALIWPPSTAPEVKIVSIGGEATPSDPLASFGTNGADVVLPETSTVQVVIETTNVEDVSQVQVRLTPRFNASFTTVDATMDSVISTTPLKLRWLADVPVSNGYSAMQVKVVRP